MNVNRYMNRVEERIAKFGSIVGLRAQPGMVPIQKPRSQWHPDRNGGSI